MNHQQPNRYPPDPALQAASARPVRSSVSRTKAAGASLAQSRGMVLAILFGVTGAIGIPLLWMNKRFSTAERIFWSLVVLSYTSLLIGGTLWIVWWAYRMVTGG